MRRCASAVTRSADPGAAGRAGTACGMDDEAKPSDVQGDADGPAPRPRTAFRRCPGRRCRRRRVADRGSSAPCRRSHLVVIAAIGAGPAHAGDRRATRRRIRSSVRPPLPASPPALLGGSRPADAVRRRRRRHDGSAAELRGWRGKPVEVVVDYVGTKTWDGVTQLDREGLLDRRAAGRRPPGLLGTADPDGRQRQPVARGAAGEYDQHFRDLAQDLVNGHLGQRDDPARLGDDGHWFAWSGIRQPGAVGRWPTRRPSPRCGPCPVQTSPSTGRWRCDNADPEPMYPGDNYVDLIGADVYDTSFAHNYSPTDHVAGLERLPDREVGPELARRLSRASTASGSASASGVSPTAATATAVATTRTSSSRCTLDRPARRRLRGLLQRQRTPASVQRSPLTAASSRRPGRRTSSCSGRRSRCPAPTS